MLIDREKPRTYVLVGSESETELGALSARDDVEIIKFKERQSLEKAISEANITTPANIILIAHGNPNGSFMWNYGEYKTYAQLFDSLPDNGISSITIGTCYGGSANAPEILQHAPVGAIVQSFVGAENVGLETSTAQFLRESKGLTNPSDLLIEALDNFDYQEYKKIEAASASLTFNEDRNADKALPHILGIGGNPPILLDMNEEVGKLAIALQSNSGLDEQSWQNAIKRIQDKFDTTSERINLMQQDTKIFGLGADKEQELDNNIIKVAEKMRRGEMPTNIEEKRIAYAITAAYMDNSGGLSYLQSKAIDGSWLQNKDIYAETLKDLEKSGWTKGIDGTDQLGKNAHIDFTDIQAVFRKMNIKTSEADLNNDDTLDGCEIAHSLNDAAKKGANPITKLFLGR